MDLDKNQLRAFYKELRAALTDEELEEKSQLIAKQVAIFLDGRKALRHFHLFFPISRQREINTFPIKEYLEERKGIIYTSRVEADSLTLHTLRLKAKTGFEMDKWGIPVPKEFDLVSNEAIQVVFVPLLAYDRRGNRVGFGKGYYDKFLASLHPSVAKIGLSFFPPEVEILSEIHDITLDYCITPENSITF